MTATAIKRENFDSLEAYAEALEAHNSALEAKINRGSDLRLKVSEKGGLSIYGLGRWPVTLYKRQWFRLLSHAQEIVDFLRDHDDELSEKEERPEVKA